MGVILPKYQAAAQAILYISQPARSCSACRKIAAILPEHQAETQVYNIGEVIGCMAEFFQSLLQSNSQKCFSIIKTTAFQS